LRHVIPQVISCLSAPPTFDLSHTCISSDATPSAPAATAAPQKKEPTAAELKAEKAAAKAAQKAAREAQQAAVEAAIAAK